MTLPPRRQASGAFALLPLLLLAVMAGLGLILEVVFYDTLLWPTKLPLAALLAAAFLRRPRDPRG